MERRKRDEKEKQGREVKQNNEEKKADKSRDRGRRGGKDDIKLNESGGGR